MLKNSVMKQWKVGKDVKSQVIATFEHEADAVLFATTKNRLRTEEQRSPWEPRYLIYVAFC